MKENDQVKNSNPLTVWFHGRKTSSYAGRQSDLMSDSEPVQKDELLITGAALRKGRRLSHWVPSTRSLEERTVQQKRP